MKVKVKKIGIVFFLIFFMADHCLWIINAKSQSKVNEICWMTILFLLFITFRDGKYKEILNKKKYFFNYEVIFTVIMGVYSAIQSYLIHAQSLMQGIAPQRFMIMGFFLYFVLMKYINDKEYGLELLKNVFLNLGYCELFLYISQYFLIHKIHFLQVSYTIRLDNIRMNLGSIAVPYVVFNAVNNIYKNKRLSWTDILSIAAGFFYSFGIAQTRIVLVAYIVALIGGYLAWKKGGKRKFIVLFFLIGIIVFLSQIELFSFLIDGMSGNDMSSKTRELGRAYYLLKIAEHPIWGCGYINTNNANAVAYSGMNSITIGTIAWVDLGIYGLTFFFGFVGLLWFLLLYIKMTMKSFKIAKTGNLIFLMYMLYSVILCPNNTGFLWYISSTIELIIWICLMEGEYKKSEISIE